MLSKKRNGWLWVVMLFAVCAVVYGMLSSYPRELAVYSDELRYLDVARSLLQGRGLRVRNMPSDYQKILYPLCILPALLLKTTAAQITAIGPVIMMKSVADATRDLGIHTVVSLNPIMVDGTGMCGGCRVTVGEETKFACVDGPEFDGHLVDFKGLMSRQRMYRDKEAVEKDHICHIGLGGDK